MIRIAVVGKIGSGKTYVANAFNFPVFNADKEVSIIYKKNRNFYEILKKKIPKYIKTFPINKKEILDCILSDEKKFESINQSYSSAR